jgi:hypothetical protein
MLLELRDQLDFSRRRDGSDAARTRARHERPAFLSLRQIPVNRAAMQTELRGDRRDRRSVLHGGHDALA